MSNINIVIAQAGKVLRSYLPQFVHIQILDIWLLVNDELRQGQYRLSSIL